MATIEAKGWSGTGGGEIEPVEISITGPLPGTGSLLVAITPTKGEPVYVMVDEDRAYELAGALTRTRMPATRPA